MTKKGVARSDPSSNGTADPAFKIDCQPTTFDKVRAVALLNDEPVYSNELNPALATDRQVFREAVLNQIPRVDGEAIEKALLAAVNVKRAAPTQAERLLELAGRAEYFHTADGTAFALVKVCDQNSQEHTETLPVRSKLFRNWLSRELYLATHKAASVKSVQDALGVLEARANYDGPERAVFCRLAASPNAIHLDLCNAGWQTAVVTPRGWRIAPAAEGPLFRRLRGMLALPVPQHGGNLNDLRRFVNVGDDANWQLVVAWLLQACNPSGPYPILALSGEQGSAKSTMARVLRSLVDPSVAPLRSQPRDERDLAIAAKNAWVIALDNLSYIEPWFSDALCRLSTGGGFGTRELFTDDEEIIFDAQRPVIMTGIEDVATRGDLADRALLVCLSEIEDEQRQTETAFWRDFAAAHPKILGALLDALAGVLREHPNVQLAKAPRMADFAVWAVAAERALLWEEGSFLKAYNGNRAGAVGAVLESDTLYPAFAKFADGIGQGCPWQGSSSELLAELAAVAGEKTANSKSWPSSPRALSGRLRRLAPALRKVGIALLFDQSDGSKNSKRLIVIERLELSEGEYTRKRPSAPSAPSATTGFADGADGADGQMQTRSPSRSYLEDVLL